jgi:hypothetical protein
MEALATRKGAFNDYKQVGSLNASEVARPCYTTKLRELPKALSTKQSEKSGCGQGNDLGYSNNLKDRWPKPKMGNPQPSPSTRTRTCELWMLFID